MTSTTARDATENFSDACINFNMTMSALICTQLERARSMRWGADQANLRIKLYLLGVQVGRAVMKRECLVVEALRNQGGG